MRCSRAGGHGLAESGKQRRRQPRKCSLLLTDLERRISAAMHGMELVPLVFPDGEDDLAFAADQAHRVCFVNDAFTFLPINGQLDSELYLCLVGLLFQQ